MERPTQIAIVFDRPIRPLEGVDEGPLGFSIEPALAGTWSWVGTHGVVFEPLNHEFPRATEYHVRIAQDLTAVDGARLTQTWSQQFETPSPKVALSDCNALTAAPDGGMSVTIEPPVDESELKRVLHVEVASMPDPPRGLEKLDLGEVRNHPLPTSESASTTSTTSASTASASTTSASTASTTSTTSASTTSTTSASTTLLSEPKPVFHRLEFTLRRDPARQDTYRILPRPTWPVLSQIRFRVDAGVRSKEGPIPSSSSVERVCKTAGLPYAEASYERVRSRDGSDFDTVYLDFPNPPDQRALLAGIRITPTARLRVTTNERGLSSWHDQLDRAPDPSQRPRPLRIELTEFRPSTEYQVTIAPGLAGAFGGRTRYAQRIAFSSERATPSVVTAIRSGQFEPERLDSIEVLTSGLAQFEHAAVALTPEQLLGVIEESSAESSPLANQLLSNAWRRQTIAMARHEGNHSTRVDLRSLFESRLSGSAVLYSARAENAAPSQPHWLSISDLAITAKYSRYGGLVWLTGLRDAQPRPGVAVYALHSCGRTELGRTGQDGSLLINTSEFFVDGSSEPARGTALLADDGKQWTLLPVGRAQTMLPRGNMSRESERPRLAVFTDRDTYCGGENVFVKGYVHRQAEGTSRPIRGSRVHVRLLNGSNRNEIPSVSETIVPSNAYGGFVTQFTLPKESPRVAYVVQA
ncbi:MAG TPA: hypothetical protein VKP30_01580, partial [Polyangiaceae bacterium]|nr:hypothetical protein [Polyangiaceae bacterium]